MSVRKFICSNNNGESHSCCTYSFEQRADLRRTDVELNSFNSFRSHLQLDRTQRFYFIPSEPINPKCNHSSIRNIQRNSNSGRLYIFTSDDERNSQREPRNADRIQQRTDL